MNIWGYWYHDMAQPLLFVNIGRFHIDLINIVKNHGLRLYIYTYMYIYIYIYDHYCPEGFCFLVVLYIHVLGLVLAHVAVITLSYAPIAGYNLTFLAGNLLLLLLVFIYYLLLSWAGYLLTSIIIATIIIILFIYLQPFCTILPCNSLCTASFEHWTMENAPYKCQ